MRRVAFNRGWIAGLTAFAVAQPVAASAPATGFDGLDRFGRVADLTYTGPASAGGTTALHAYEYPYDLADQPIWKEVTQRDHGGQSHANQRSWLYGYDGLHRLAAADMGALTGHTGQTPSPAVVGSTLHPAPRLEGWNLDPLGNWEARTIAPIPGDSAGTQTTTHAVDLRNELESVGIATTGGSGGPTSTADDYIYDITGNLVLDGSYFYQYDAWGRLAKVSHRGDLELTPTGQHASGAAGDWIVHYTYDALGRLARLQRPLSGFPGYNHTEHFYYDGARRVQEVFHSIDAGSGSEQSSEEENTTPTLTTWVDREYIHSAGPGSYLDEFVCEVANLATSQTPLFHLQDANYNVLGLATAAGQVVRQHTFDAYGRLIHAEDFATTLRSRVGHQGLFFTRLDAPQGWPELSVTEVAPGSGGAAPLTLPVTGLYHTHNRSYAPGLGRWLQRDPNGTGGLVIDGPDWRTGDPHPVDALRGPAGVGLFDDGANWHAAFAASPARHTDPTGLFIAIGGAPEIAVVMGERAKWQAADAQRIGGGVSLLGQMLHEFFAYGGPLAGPFLAAGAIHANDLAIQLGFQPPRWWANGGGALPQTAGAGRGGRIDDWDFIASGFGDDEFQSFESFAAFKRAFGPAGPGLVWHHIVEQSKVGQFGAQQIHTTRNIIPIDRGLNERLNGFFGSKNFSITGSQSLTIRDWLKSQSFEFNHRFGLDAIERLSRGGGP